MGLTRAEVGAITDIITRSLRRKLEHYRPETRNMPFHYRLLGRDRMALFSFIHSLNTTFGVSIFEPVAETIATIHFQIAHKQYKVGNAISEGAQTEIQHIMNDLSTGTMPNKRDETERIRKVCRYGATNKVKTVKVDLYVKDVDNVIYLFDLKTAKPNISNFKDFKRTLLEWIAIYLYNEPAAAVHSLIAIPYNPYAPQPYERWTMRGMLDCDDELKVAEEFWDFLGGAEVYSELLDCFERAGIALRPEIDRWFSGY